ncbi:MAG TPA: serine hydrolase domain-containing protein [Gemmatimonadales bacterium]|jgi:CubicO group peptidase (beta-lactamase class C family)|nr:serine hydrolase domain-containing protein [Gemmatimonadales bacterium]
MPRLCPSAFLAAFLVLSPPASAQQRPALRAAWEEMRSFYRATLQSEGFVGSSLVLIRGDSTIGRDFYGMADLATGRAVDSNTIYHWASITKTFTAIAIMQLRDRGLLSLDDPIVKYVPELREVHDSFGSIDSVTIRHLLSHSAGFRNGTWPWGGDKPWHPFEPTRWAQVVAMMPYTEILFKPGSRYSYSNPGYIFLGRVIEALSGDDYEVYMEKNVLRPLGMTHSYFDRTPYHLLRYRSNNYTVVKGKPEPNGLDFDTGITVSNGGLNAPFTDMTKYLQFLVGAPGISEDARNVLARSSLEEMWKGRVPVTDVAGADFKTAPSDSIGMGYFILQNGGQRVIGHTGSQASFRAFFYINQDTRSAIIANFNTVGEENAEHPSVAPLFQGLLQRYIAGILPALRP